MSLTQAYECLKSFETSHILRRADSMKVFCDGDATFVFGEWREWEKACQTAGKTLPPADFKKKATNVT